jgi:LPS sulfotransferase NodH
MIINLSVLSRLRSLVKSIRGVVSPGVGVKFVLISTQRTGTTLLTEYLKSHHEVEMGYEVFKMAPGGYNYDVDKGYKSYNGSVSDYLDDYFSKGLKANRACGFKVMLNQLQNYPGILEYIILNNVKCIFLERDNVVDVAVSRLCARYRKLHHSNEDVNLALVPIDAEKLLDELSLIEQSTIVLRDMLKDIDHINVKYNDLVLFSVNTLNSIFRYLGQAEVESLTASVKKLNDSNLRNVIKNYDDIYKVLINTKYKRYIESDIYQDINHKCKCIYIHIPKVAGISIEESLFGEKVGHKKAIDYLDDNKKLFEEYYSFSFVRNPYDRLVSAYIFLRDGGRNDLDKQWADENLSEFNSFKDFVISLDKLIMKRFHFYPQYLFLCDKDDRVIVDYVGKYENLHEDFKHVCNVLGRDCELPHKNRTLKKSFDYREYYDYEMKEIVYKCYKKDFDLFGYER